MAASSRWKDFFTARARLLYAAKLAFACREKRIFVLRRKLDFVDAAKLIL
jgi:hypothetical protein